MKNIGSTLKSIRQSNNLTQSQLAKKINITPYIISHIETGRRNASLVHIKKLGESLGVSIPYILFISQSDEDLRSVLPTQKYKEWMRIKDLVMNDLKRIFE